MIPVILETPYAPFGDRTVEDNVEYARRCMLDCLGRGEAPLPSHLLYPQVLDDNDIEQRQMGIMAGYAWWGDGIKVILYIDHGVTPGMAAAQLRCIALDAQIEHRSLTSVD